MTKELRALIEAILASLPTPKRVLEIGSRRERGQQELAELRDLFPTSEYVGLDKRPGPGVDVVADAGQLPYPDHAFDLILCLETLEHAQEPWRVAAEIRRVLRAGGVAIVSSQQNFPIHLHPSDYFRYTPYGLASILGLSKHLAMAISPPFENEVQLNPKQVVVVAWTGKRRWEQPLIRAIKEARGRINVHKPYRHRLQASFKFLQRAWQELRYRTEVAFFLSGGGGRLKRAKGEGKRLKK